MKEITQYYTDDYAGLTVGNLEFYYGYEVEDTETNEWCFQVKNKGAEIYRVTSSEIEELLNDRYLNPIDYLLAGIGMWIRLIGIN